MKLVHTTMVFISVRDHRDQDQNDAGLPLRKKESAKFLLVLLASVAPSTEESQGLFFHMLNLNDVLLTVFICFSRVTFFTKMMFV